MLLVCLPLRPTYCLLNAFLINHVLSCLRLICQTPQAYKDSDFKQYWMPDSNCRQCYECGDRFNTFRRRHHCRICGQIFCSRCCNQVLPGRIMGYTGETKLLSLLLPRLTLAIRQLAIGESWRYMAKKYQDLSPV